MKKLMTAGIAVLLGLSVALAGCGSAAKTNDKVQQPAAEEVQQPQETDAADTGTAEEKTESTDTYDPAHFDISEVYEAPKQKASVDITGCDTFTQIVDKLEDGKGYANVKIGDTDVLLVSSGTYEWEEGKYAAIDADIFYYKDNVPTYLATLSAGGTAYPLAVKDGDLLVGGNHFMASYLIDGGSLIELEEAYVKYDTGGNATYYYKTCNSQFEDYDSATAESRLDDLYGMLESADVIEFQTVGGASSSQAKLPL